MTHHDEEHLEYEYLPDPPELIGQAAALSDRQAALFAAVNLLTSVRVERPDGPMLVSDLDQMARGIADRFMEWLEK